MTLDISAKPRLSVESFFSLMPLEKTTPEQTALFDKTGAVSKKQLLTEVLQLAANIAESKEQRWALACDNTAAFIRGLLALLAAGKTVCLPANSKPGTLGEISQHATLLLTDTSGEGFEGECFLLHLLQELQEKASSKPFHPRLQQSNLIFFTSGSSGQPSAITKKLWQLENEINALEQLWGTQLEGSTTLACVAHQHIYGVLFRILWPLLAQRPVDICQYEYPENLLANIAKHKQVTIIASPAQLERLPEELDWSVCQNKVKAVFSSGAPLGAAFATKAQTLFSVFPEEVLGSTETGGVAWRQQKNADPTLNLWNPLPGVKVDLSDGLLKVHSAWLDEPEAGFVMGDQAELFDNQCFLLKGRADLIAKIEGKRVSLTEMARRLAKTVLVEKAEVVALEGQRKQIGAVIILTQKGKNILAEQGRLSMSRQLKNTLAQYFEAVTLPRKWRYPDTLPVNSQGKLARAELTRLFDTGAHND